MTSVHIQLANCLPFLNMRIDLAKRECSLFIRRIAVKPARFLGHISRVLYPLYVIDDLVILFGDANARIRPIAREYKGNVYIIELTRKCCRVINCTHS